MSQPAILGPHETPENTQARQIALDELENPAVRLGVGYWRSLRGARRYPARGDLRPRDMAGILGHMILVKVLEDGDFEYRIVGDAQVQAYARPFQGKRVSEVVRDWPVFGRIVKGIYTTVAGSGEPFALRGAVGRDFPDAKFVYSEHAFLPLGAQTVDHLMVVSHYAARPFANGEN